MQQYLITQIWNIIIYELGQWGWSEYTYIHTYTHTHIWRHIYMFIYILYSTHSPQQSHPLTSRRLCVSVCCLLSIVSVQGHFNAMGKFANQLFWSSAHQAGLSSSRARPVPLFVRFFWHGSSGWQRHCASDPSSFSGPLLSMTSNSKRCQSDDLLHRILKK